ncbi:MAG TPA: aspartate dehydrogenase [Chloroflexota bacterium]|nr:aspartate dehydrogenase [Chloroflexota bacterium]
MRIGVIGAGAIGRYLIEAVRAGRAGDHEIVVVGDIVPGLSLDGVPYTTDIRSLPSYGLDLVVEAAAQAAAREYAVPMLEAGLDVMIMSVGALADEAFAERLRETARRVGRRVYIPSGALGGLDAVKAGLLSGLESVELVSTKPPVALQGAAYFDTHPVDWDAIRGPTVVYEGPAAEAVGYFPQNVNVAAVLSLAGVGPHKTRVRVVADPTATTNQHSVRVKGGFGTLEVNLSNLPTPENPKTSWLAALAAVAMLRRLADPFQIGQ